MKKNNGFTLVELSVSLVIIGLIVGGVLGAGSIVRSAKLQTIISESEEYKAAYDTFVQRFKQMPGDFSDGAKYWGNDCEGSTGGSDLCSGEGDRKIDHAADDALTGTSETFVAWKHLEKANLVKESFTGLEGTGSNCSGADQCATINENIPGSSWKDTAGYYIYSGTNETALFLGAQTSNDWNNASHIKPNNARSIDSKIDDGDPINGNFRASFITGATITNAATCLDGATTYNLDNTAEHCGAIFILD